MNPKPESLKRQRIDLQGIVQGIGFRPFVFALAREMQFSGSVRNHSAGVTIEVEGPADDLPLFLTRLQGNAPPLARIDSIQVSSLAVHGSRGFKILASDFRRDSSTPISPDISVCDDCIREMRDPADRRFEYPFINCTNCGPRFTIIRDIPYDRIQTTMASFVMCERCDSEYRDPTDRRFHAQPNACPDCGPQVWFATRNDLIAANLTDSRHRGWPTGSAAVVACRAAVADGSIIAIKGIGGFHLACDATNNHAVALLRDRKGRGDRPLAIMVADAHSAQQIADLSEAEMKLLDSREHPIVVLKRRQDSGILSPLVAPGNDSVGIMLPYSPLHHLLTADAPPLVMTSGNLSEEPIVRTNEEVMTRLGGIVDAFLLHDRDIHVVCDDSVVRMFAGRELSIRRSRGYAPMPVRLDSAQPSVLSVGGELKAAFCVTKNDYAYMSQHIGDMENIETLQALERGIEHFCRLFRVQPEVIACDMHPGYLSTSWAKQFAATADIPVIRVQHHHAHIAALRAEYNCHEPVTGICFDGTGFGTDDAIWGGEVLVVTDEGFERQAHLKYVPLPGGDASVRRPWRMALAHLWAAGIAWDDDLPSFQAGSDEERTILKVQLQRNVNCVPTSSMGRLFDAVSSLIGVRHTVTYEAQAAMEMEAMSANINETAYRFRFDSSEPAQFDPAPVLDAIITDLRKGVDRSVIAGRFQASVAELIAELCRRERSRSGISIVGLSGGVFQNVHVTGQTVQMLKDDGFQTLVHRQVPPNDGGIALGQAVIAGQRMVQSAAGQGTSAQLSISREVATTQVNPANSTELTRDVQLQMSQDL